MNIVVIDGFLGSDPKSFSDGKVVRFSLGVNRTTTGRDGVKERQVDWFDVVVFGQPATFVKQYLHKGDHAYVQGRLAQSSFRNKDGVEMKKIEIVANSVESPRAARDARAERSDSAPQDRSRSSRYQAPEPGAGYDEENIF